MRCICSVLGVASLLSISTAQRSSAQNSPAPTPNETITTADYAARRAELTRQLDSGVVIAFGEVEPVVEWPVFFQLPAFEYLTGFNESDAALVIEKRKDATKAVIFVPTRDRGSARFLGERTAPRGIRQKTGIDGRNLDSLKPYIDSLAGSGLPFYIVSDVHTADFAREDSLSRGARLVAQLRSAHPWLQTYSLDTTVDRMRAKKSAAEIALLRHAVEISTRAHREAMKATAAGCTETEIQSVLDGTFRRYGGDRPGYGSIVGSGHNATTLHYMKDDDVMHDGDLVLIDAATSFNHYSADVTRTFPVSGKFTPAQRDIYQVVRDAQDAFVRQIKSGVAADVAFDSSRAVVTKELVRLGLMESDTALFDPAPGVYCGPTGCSQRALYAWHGYGGHGLGLEVHDPAQYYSGKNTFMVGDVLHRRAGHLHQPR